MANQTFTYPDGSRYEGEWRSEKRHGQGKWTRPDGMEYVGEWKDDKPNGYGTLTSPDGTKRTGEWQEGKYISSKEPSYQEPGYVTRREPLYQEPKENDGLEERHYYLIGLIISFIGGLYGIDRFYRGQTGLGILKLLTFGGFMIWWLVDLFVWAGKTGNAYRGGVPE